MAFLLAQYHDLKPIQLPGIFSNFRLLKSSERRCSSYIAMIKTLAAFALLTPNTSCTVMSATVRPLCTPKKQFFVTQAGDTMEHQERLKFSFKYWKILFTCKTYEPQWGIVCNENLVGTCASHITRNETEHNHAI